MKSLSQLSEFEPFMNENQKQAFMSLKSIGPTESEEHNQEEIADELLKEVERQNKNHLTDYEALLWKAKVLNQSDFPQSFSLIKIKEADPNNVLEGQSPVLNFSPLSLKTSQLATLGSKMLMKIEYVQKTFSLEEISTLILKIANTYNIVSYHNFSHGFNLFNLLFQCYQTSEKLREVLGEEGQFHSLIAALTHDANHNGTNNDFQIKNKTQLAKVAQNESVLEKMHISTFFELLRKNPALDIVERSQFPHKSKELIVKLILATDMAKHTKQLQVIEEKREVEDEQNSMDYLQNLFHACDIGNPCLEFDEFITWSALLSYEFNEQTKLQKQLGIPVTGYFKFRDNTDFLKGQSAFVGKFVLPLWKQIALKWSELAPMLKNIERNLVELQLRIQQ